MESRVPLPTDNIYKFYALFGLLLFVFSSGASFYVTRTSNEVVYSTLPELENLKQIEQPSRAEQAKVAVLQRKLEINKSDKQALHYAIGALFALSFFASYYGFRKWQTEVQPVLDRTAKAQMEIAELQLAKLRHEMGKLAPKECNLSHDVPSADSGSREPTAQPVTSGTVAS